MQLFLYSKKMFSRTFYTIFSQRSYKNTNRILFYLKSTILATNFDADIYYSLYFCHFSLSIKQTSISGSIFFIIVHLDYSVICSSGLDMTEKLLKDNFYISQGNYNLNISVSSLLQFARIKFGYGR